MFSALVLPKQTPITQLPGARGVRQRFVGSPPAEKVIEKLLPLMDGGRLLGTAALATRRFVSHSGVIRRGLCV